MGKLSSRDRKLAHLAGENVSNIENRNFELAAVNASQLILQGPLPIVPTTGITALSQRVCWSYIGYTQKTLVADYIQFIQTGTLAAGAQVVELGLATSTSAPTTIDLSMSLTVVAVASALPDLTTGTTTNGLVRQNTTALGYSVSPATHLWLAYRSQFATTQPTYLAVNMDLSVGFVRSTLTVTSPLTVGTTYSASGYSQAITTAAIAPLLRLQIRE